MTVVLDMWLRGTNACGYCVMYSPLEACRIPSMAVHNTKLLLLLTQGWVISYNLFLVYDQSYNADKIIYNTVRQNRLAYLDTDTMWSRLASEKTLKFSSWLDGCVP
jgi:hypothetical protein